MKILMINSVCGIGSTGRICTDIAEELENLGHEVKIAYGRGSVSEKYSKYAVKIGSNFGIKLHALKTRFFDKTGFGSKRATKKFINWVKEYNPDIIHLHNIHGYYIHIGILFKYLKTCGKKIIWTLHDCWAYTGHCAHFTAVNCEKYKTQCQKCILKKEYPGSLFYDNSKSNYLKKKELFCGIPNMTLVTPSFWLTEVTKGGFLKEYPIKVIQNGLDFSIFKPTESDFRERFGLKDKKILLGVANVWGKRKGLEDFIKLSFMIDDSYKIILVGLSEKQIATLPKSIFAIPRTDSVKSLCEVYTAADIFINPSTEETMGLVTVEALACGTPVIVYNKTAVPEVVDSTCGIVLKENTPEEIFENLEGFEFDSDDCIKHAKLYDKKIKYKEYLKIYGLYREDA